MPQEADKWHILGQKLKMPFKEGKHMFKRRRIYMDVRWLKPEFHRDEGYAAFKCLGFEFCFYWPCPDWSFGFHLLFFGHGFNVNLGPPWCWFVHNDYESDWGS